MTKTLLLIGASLRSGLRWASRHIYSWLVLTPVVLGMTYLTLSRLAENPPAWQPSPWLTVVVAVLIETCLISISLSRASAEIYHLRRPEAYFDSLPLPLTAHLHAALASRIARTTVTGVILSVAHWLFARGDLVDPSILMPLALLVALTALAQVLASLNWIHWNHTSSKLAAFVALIMLALTATLGGLLLALIFRPDEFLTNTRPWVLATSCIWVLLLYILIHRSHARWRIADVEYARRLQAISRSSVFGLRAFQRRLTPIVAAQLVRDLQLTLRAFSSALYVCIGLAFLSTMALVATLTTDLLPPVTEGSAWFDITWLPSVMAVKTACLFAVSSLAVLMAVLVAYQLPHLWLERAIGTTGLDIWQAKLWYTRLISVPAPVAIWLAGIFTGSLPLSYSIPLLVECLWLWWLVSSFIGSLSFEMPTRPGLAIIVMITFGLAAGAISAMLWPVGLIIYGYAMGSLADRGRTRARYFLITEGD